VIAVVCAALVGNDLSLPANQPNQGTYSEQQKSAQGPVSPQLITTDTSQNQRDDKAPDGWMVRLTFLIVLVSVAQFWMFYRQWRVMRESLGDTQKTASAALESAQAANLQAKAMIASERAVIRFPDPLFRDRMKEPPGNRMVAGSLSSFGEMELNVHNAGRTWAILEATEFNWFIATELPATPFYDPTGPLGMNHLLKSEQSFALKTPDTICVLNGGQLSRIKNGTDRLWFYGFLRYRDFMDDIYEIGFVGHWEEIGTHHIGFGPPLPPRGVVWEGPAQYIFLRPVVRK
jgi:hypothetical protein